MNVLQFLIKALWDVALFQLVKSDFPQWNIAYIFRTEQWKNNGILFTKIGKLCLL
jgi:hypothetical protein